MTDPEKTNSKTDLHDAAAFEPVILYVKFQASEVNNASWIVYREQTGGKLVFTTFCTVFVFSVILSLSYLGIFAKSPPPGGSYSTWIALALFLAILIVPPTSAIWLWRSLKASKLSSFSTESRYHSTTTFTINTDGFQISFDSVMLLTAWKKVSICYELAESLALVVEEAVFLLPKRCFASNQQLRDTRRMIIEKGVTYATAGPQKANIVFDADADKPTEVNVKRPEAEENAEDIAQEVLAQETDVVVQIEPTSLPTSLQPLTIECNYSLQELKEIDKTMFFRYDLPGLGIRYILFLVFCYGYGNFAVQIMGEVGEMLRTALLLCAPLAVPGFFIHARYLFEKRIEEIREFVKEDLPITVTISQQECTVRSRRASFSYPWSSFYKCYFSKHYYILRAPHTTIIIPKSALGSLSEEIFAENLLRLKFKKCAEWGN